MAEISRADLRTAIAQLGPVAVRTDDVEQPGVILYPHHVTSQIIEQLNAMPGDGAPIHPLDAAGGEADDELAAIASAVAHLESLGSEAQGRVMRYLASRYGAAR